MESSIEKSWKKELREEFGKEYFQKLDMFVREEYTANKIYPAYENIFEAFTRCPFEKVKVVILGQDPYHGGGQATGLSFGVTAGTKIPPSLQNIFKEIEADTGTKPLRENGDLTRWATQGVLLLNSTLTVQEGAPGSHQKRGWEEFTDAVIQTLKEKRENIVFILWGNYARAKGANIDRTKHFVIESPHPSPFSAYNGFFGSKPFSQTNEYLQTKNEKLIDWS